MAHLVVPQADGPKAYARTLFSSPDVQVLQHPMNLRTTLPALQAGTAVA